VDSHEIVLDFDQDGRLFGAEVLDASKLLPQALLDAAVPHELDRWSGNIRERRPRRVLDGKVLSSGIIRPCQARRRTF